MTATRAALALFASLALLAALATPAAAQEPPADPTPPAEPSPDDSPPDDSPPDDSPPDDSPPADPPLVDPADVVPTPESPTPSPTASPKPSLDPETLSPPDADRLLVELVRRLHELRGRAAEQATRMRLAESDDEVEAARERLQAIEQELAEVARDVDEVATGVGLHDLDAAEEELDLTDELVQLTEPLVRELKGVTALPRQISDLSKQVEKYSARLRLIERALERIDLLEEETAQTSPQLRGELRRLRQDWLAQRQIATAERDRAQLQLARIESDRPSIVVASQQALRSFFRKRGKNVVLAVAAFVVVLLLLTRGHGLLQKLSPLHRKLPRPFYVRLVDVVLVAFTAFASFSAALTTLYLLGDWTLLSLAVLFLFGLTWAAKQGLPEIWQQVRTVLNIGSVREGERLVLGGVPWHVKSLGFTSTLVNPAFGDLRLRLPVRDLVDLNSRRTHGDEPWFPCAMGDWVLLGDGVHGQVQLQTHEMVQVTLLGGATKTYPTGDFLGLSPTNLSQGFRVETTFGLDYADQAQITEDIPSTLKAALEHGLAAQGHQDALKAVLVEFDEAAGSSLNLKILADFEGSAAPARGKLRRLLQRLTVDACNEHGWNIPFPQITVHQAAS